jgi:hypothetical protein
MKTMKHFSEAELLETYYMQPGQSMPVMMHLADCSDCAARYARLERKIREAATCDVDKPDTFWLQQRLSIMRRIATRPMQLTRAGRAFAMAAAASIAFVLGGFFVYTTVEPGLEEPPVVITAQQPAPAPAADDLQVAGDPWQSEELEEFRGVVEWESWVESRNGDNSL